MHAIEFVAEIDQNHQIHLQLPETVNAGKAKVIVMYEDEAAQPQKPITFGLFKEKIQISDDFDEPLIGFSNQLPATPENAFLSREEIQQYIQDERQSWDK